MGQLIVNDHFQACSCAALNNVYTNSPKDTLLDYISKACKKSKYLAGSKTYTYDTQYGYYVHVFFVGPDQKTIRKGSGWASEKGWGCDALADYIKEHKLGPVVQSVPRWNHRHGYEREAGKGDLIAYIWSPDPDALKKWHEKHKTDAIPVKE